jgi:cytidine deaminase
MKKDYIHYNDLTEIQQQLLQVAADAKEFAYNPYSNFYVGAALLTEDDTVFTGCNVENASYGLVICAERTAIFKAVSEGHKSFNKMAIVTRGGNHEHTEPAGPCGACRQVINEFADLTGEDIEILLSNEDMQEVLITSIRELLPMSFGPDKLV